MRETKKRPRRGSYICNQEIGVKYQPRFKRQKIENKVTPSKYNNNNATKEEQCSRVKSEDQTRVQSTTSLKQSEDSDLSGSLDDVSQDEDAENQGNSGDLK